MKTIHGSPLVTLAASTLLIATARSAEPPGLGSAQIHLQNARNQPVGEATLRQTPNGVVLTAKLRDLPPGTHGFHFHQTGKCLPPFTSAGDHFNPTRAAHGFETAKGPHAGDLPNLEVPASGDAAVHVFVSGVTLAAGKPESLMDDDGAALVVHAGPDDYATDPAGDSGDRIACGVLERPRETAAGAPPPRTADR